MSFEAMTWAVRQSPTNSGQKLVLLLLANHANGHTGQCNPSQNLLAEECCMGLTTLRRHLTDLEELGLIQIEHKYSDNLKRPNQYVLNINTPNWRIDSSNRMDPPSKMDGPLPPNRMIEPGRRTSNKTNIGEDPQKAHLFEVFWRAYPRKTNKVFARKSFMKMEVDHELVRTMIQAIKKQEKSEQWKNPQFIPHPSSWLNGHRWEDETDEAGPLSGYELLKKL